MLAANTLQQPMAPGSLPAIPYVYQLSIYFLGATTVMEQDPSTSSAAVWSSRQVTVLIILGVRISLLSPIL
jgi:hypothetical protein